VLLPDERHRGRRASDAAAAQLDHAACGDRTTPVLECGSMSN
jgi:hypothetical protein